MLLALSTRPSLSQPTGRFAYRFAGLLEADLARVGTVCRVVKNRLFAMVGARAVRVAADGAGDGPPVPLRRARTGVAGADWCGGGTRRRRRSRGPGSDPSRPPIACRWRDSHPGLAGVAQQPQLTQDRARDRRYGRLGAGKWHSTHAPPPPSMMRTRAAELTCRPGRGPPWYAASARRPGEVTAVGSKGGAEGPHRLGLVLAQSAVQGQPGGFGAELRTHTFSWLLLLGLGAARCQRITAERLSLRGQSHCGLTTSPCSFSIHATMTRFTKFSATLGAMCPAVRPFLSIRGVYLPAWRWLLP